MLRGLTLVVVCAPFALSLGFMAMNSENHGPWTVAFFSYVMLAGLIASSYAFLDGENRSLKKGVGLLALIWGVVLVVTVGYLSINHQL
jgi:peptidoglycan/LPS O-acetylase OafA/YrhL